MEAIGPLLLKLTFLVACMLNLSVSYQFLIPLVHFFSTRLSFSEYIIERARIGLCAIVPLAHGPFWGLKMGP